MWEIFVGVDMFVLIGLGAFFLLSLSCFSGVVIWRIKVIGDTVYYRNYFGITRKYTAKLDKVVITQNRKIIVYHEGKRIFSIDDNVSFGYYDFLSWSRKHVQVISEKRESLDIFNGNVKKPGEIIGVHLILIGVCLAMFIWLAVDFYSVSELEYTTATMKEFEVVEDDMKIYFENEDSYYEISGYKETLTNTEEFEAAYKEQRSFKIGFVSCGNEESGIYYLIESLTDENDNVYVTREAMREYSKQRYINLALIFLVPFAFWIIWFGLTIYVGRNPHKLSKWVVRLFFKDGALH